MDGVDGVAHHAPVGPGWSPRTLAAAWAGALALSVAAAALSASNGRPPEIFLPIGLSTAIYVTSGYLMARRRPENRVGYLLMLIGVCQAGIVALRHVVPVTEVLNVAFSPIGPVLLSYVLLAYPSGILEGRLERVTIGTVAAVFAVVAVATILTLEPAAHGASRCPPCEPNPLRITDLSVFPVVNDLNSLAIVGSSLAVAVLCVRRWARARGTGRRILAPVLFGGVITALGYMVISFIFATGGSISLGAQVLLLAQVLVPIGLAVTFLLMYATRGAVTGAIVQLGASPSAERLEAALRSTLGDPHLVVARWSAAAGAYLDREGRRVEVDRPGAGRAVARLERDGQPSAVIVHDSTLIVDAALIGAIVDSVRFAVESTEMRDQLRARGGDVANLPRGQVAFLFGDLEGSTEMLSTLGDAYIDVLAELRRVVREVTDRCGGRVVDARADECFLAFADPVAALTAAMDIQRRLGDAGWPSGAQPRMRMGLHVGEPELTADGYVGLDVHRAARVMASAAGGQVLASSTLAVAVEGRIPEGMVLVPLGYRTLKGIPEPEFLYRVATEVPASEGFPADAAEVVQEADATSA